MPASADDWRLMGQERYLKDATLTWQSWTAPPPIDVRARRTPGGEARGAAAPDAGRPTDAAEEVELRSWDHDHCAFCWAKFMAAEYPPEQREWREQHPEILTAGYTTVGPDGTRHWICAKCIEDFRERFRWTVVSPDSAE